MKVAYVIARGDAFGGSSLHVCDMARRLCDDGHTVKVFVGGTADMEVPQRLEARRLDFDCIPQMGRAINARRDLSALAALRTKIRQFSPDLVSAHASKAGALTRVACIGLGIPVLYTPHCWSFSDGFPNARLYLWIERILAPLARCIVTVCEQEKAFGLSHKVGRESRTVCVHNGVIEDNSVNRAHSERAGSDVPRILMVARFEEQKDHDLLLAALSDCRDLDWALTLVGDGPRKSECERLARELDLASRIDFVGYSDRVDQYLAQADIFALITHWEGFPRSVLEAMRAGLPVIVSDVGGCSEALAPGETGFVVPHGGRAALGESLRELISNRKRCSEMGVSARERFLREFTFDTMYGKYLDLYRQVVGRRKLGARPGAAAASHKVAQERITRR